MTDKELQDKVAEAVKKRPKSLRTSIIDNPRKQTKHNYWDRKHYDREGYCDNPARGY